MQEPKFYRCRHCGNLTGALVDTGVPMICCGEPMERLVPNTAEAAHETHLPCAGVDGARVTVQVGSVDHPMSEAHRIEWIYLATKNGGQRKAFCADGLPVATFALDDDAPVAAYAYCNLHGLWRTAL